MDPITNDRSEGRFEDPDYVSPSDVLRAWLGIARRDPRWFWIVVALWGVGAIPFFASTTFIGDDHLFLAFSRYESNPLSALWADKHGGEFYRPIPMLVWWLLGRLPMAIRHPAFASLSLLLHTVVGIEVGLLVGCLRGATGSLHRHDDGLTRNARADWQVSALAAGFFLVLPFPREAAYWFSASTDLFATAFGLAAILSLLGAAPRRGWLAFALGCWCKETAVVFPLLAAISIRVHTPARGWANTARRIAPALPIVAAYAGVRTWVLHGLGNSGDTAASLAGRAVQIGAGLLSGLSGAEPLSTSVAAGLGAVLFVALIVARVQQLRRSPCNAGTFRWALLWIALAVSPLLGARWVVGARYFYVSAVAICALLAEVASAWPIRWRVAILAGFSGLAFAQAVSRRPDIVAYDLRVGAARRAVVDGLSHGARVFHIAAGIKDLDLAVKESDDVEPWDASSLILGDVPASFVALPQQGSHVSSNDLDFLLAHPSLPPSGAYRFGARKIVGLARRGDDPTLDEVLKAFPDIRFIRLRPGPGHRVIYRDITETWLRENADVD